MPNKNDQQEKINEMLKNIQSGVKNVFTSEKYKQFLSAIAKFHNYSLNNTILITSQLPSSSYVAGYQAWQKYFNRHVRLGEKGIAIIGYAPKTITVEQERKDALGLSIIDASGNPVMESVKKKIPAFAVMHVYDVSQTEGEPLPRLVNELEGNVNAFNDIMIALRDVSPYPIEIKEIAGSAKGYCDYNDKLIVLKEGMSETQTMKTAIHEISHADLHEPIEGRADKRTREIEAESTACVVCSHYGIDTSDYSFPYIATWSSDKELSELQESLDRIQKQASDLIDRIDTRLSDLKKEREQEYKEPVFAIYQLKEGDLTRDLRFESYDRLISLNAKPNLELYNLTYAGNLPPDASLNKVYEIFNINPPEDFHGRSLSISDIVVIEANGECSANYVDRFGFYPLPDFIEQHKAMKSLNEQGQAAPDQNEEELRRDGETNDSIKFDNDIDLDREKTRSQLGFDNNLKSSAAPASLAERMIAAKQKAAELNNKSSGRSKGRTGEREESKCL